MFWFLYGDGVKRYEVSYVMAKNVPIHVSHTHERLMYEDFGTGAGISGMNN